ncbi:HAAS signaling domain-containing protein [Lysinibacillus sp. NPDC096418]|uniref:HAAS signaling domain-containing protein n=1 Tax=Lysinibacillus sp. NPDC096418 TaxID=3364138 RepID=UPI00381F4AA2
MKLIEAYIYEVTKRLPEKMRNDIALELRSTIEDMLPENYSELEVKNVLSKLGSPAELAASYRDTPRYLIGPQVYGAYINTIKMVAPWAILITLLVHIVESIVLFTGEEALLTAIINTFSITLANIITVLLQVLFWITIAFVIMERTGGLKGNIPMFTNKNTWTPDDLNNTIIVSKEKNIPISDIVFSIFGAVLLAILYFNADHLVGIYQSNENGKLIFTAPFFNQDTLLSYWPIILSLISLEITVNLYKLKVRKWTIPLAAINTIVHLLSTIAFFFIISNPELIHDAFIPQMADAIQTSPSTVSTFIDRFIWVGIAITIVTNIFDIFNNFRKASNRY